jgi:acyl-[acyl carrier protein]--UDP-N-acetylglucosamine O-acyltransferase
MAFELKKTKNKVMASYKTLYISDEIVEKIEKIAKENNTSFNNVVVSMIEFCLDSDKKD